MNLFDCLLIAILAYSTIMAFVRGIILELFSLVGLIAGILLAAWNYQHVALLLGRLITSLATAQIVSFLLIIIGVMVLSTLLGKALNRTAHAIGLGFFDRLLGAAFGFVRGSPGGTTTSLNWGPASMWLRVSSVSSSSSSIRSNTSSRSEGYSN